MSIKKETMNRFNAVWKDRPEWVELYNKYNPKDEVKEKSNFDENNGLDLLRECLYLLNEIPNKKYKPKSYKDSYELASVIEKYIKRYEK